MKNFILSFSLMMAVSYTCEAQVNLWQSADETEIINRNQSERFTHPANYELYKLSIEDLRAELSAVPHESQVSARNSYASFSFPMPDGSFRTFTLVEYDLMEAPLKRKYAHIKAYTGVDAEHGSKIHLNINRDQVFAAIREKGTTYYIDPYFQKGGDHYVSYDIKEDRRPDQILTCSSHELEVDDILGNTEVFDPASSKGLLSRRGAAFTLKTYRLAVTATSGFTAYHGGTTTDALNAITTIVNRINSVFERDVAVRLILIADLEALIFTDAATDPFDGITVGNQTAMMNLNQTVVDGVLNAGDYDVGHVLNTNTNDAPGQGIARRPCVCANGVKARGASARPVPVGDAFTIAIISHEMGHQFNANHTMYHCQNVNMSTSYSPGSGTTIMSYAGICTSVANVINTSDDYFHNNSISAIINYTRIGGGRNCGSTIDFNNTYPDVELDYPTITYIPVSTPIYLEGSGTDAETQNSLTYCWEQYNTGFRDFEASPWDIASPMQNEPLFRSRPPVAVPGRYFPSLPVVVNSSSSLFEQYATYARDLRFRLTVRDNASENGGAAWDQMNIKVIDQSAAGNFEITNFVVRDTVNPGEYVELTWNVADTDMSPINCKKVNIRFSIDGGDSFPYMLKENTPNDGSAFVNIPDTTTRLMRFMVEAADNVFYNITRRSSRLYADSSAPAIGLTYNDQCFSVCTPAEVKLDINSFDIGGFDDMVSYGMVDGLPAGATASFSNDQGMVGTPTTLTINLDNVSTGGMFTISFEATGPGIATQRREIDLQVTTNDFSNLSLEAPVNGSTGVELLPLLEWTLVADAESYTVELSDMIDFSNIIYTDENTFSSSSAVDKLLEAGKVYYWRVKPSNDCDPSHDINRIAAFQTKALTCDEYCSTVGQINLPTSGTNTIEMAINIGSARSVDELNVTQILGRHNDMSELKFSLEGPDGTNMVLLNDGSCPFNTPFDMGFDDDAVGVNPRCGMFNTFNEGTLFEPAGSLADLNGDPSGVTYKLIIEDVASGQGGFLTSWCFELCGAGDIESATLVRADTINMPILSSRVVGSDKLEVSHTQYSASELTITILNQPAHGTLTLNGSAITSGAQLTMQDVIDNKLSYEHQNSTADLDEFTFIVTDPGGGFLGTPAIQFYVGAVDVYNQLPEGSELTIYPNPTDASLNILLEGYDLAIDKISIYNIQGQLISNVEDIRNNAININVADLSSGFYLIAIKSGKYNVMRKFVKQ